MEYLGYSNLTFFDKLSLLWTVDAHFSGNIIGIGIALALYIVIIYIFGINFLYMIMPGGTVSGNSSTTSFPRWLPIMCLIFITLFYTGYKIDTGPSSSSLIDEWFGWGSLLITYGISFIYALWFREP